MNLSKGAKVTVEIVDERDRAVALLLDNRQWDAGGHYLVWDGTDDYGKMVPSGAYLLTATASTFTSTVSSGIEIYVDAEPTIFKMPRDRRQDRGSGRPSDYDSEGYDEPGPYRRRPPSSRPLSPPPPPDEPK